ncbi:MAG: alpha/beta fold hydrolase [Chitinophagales bacterium]|nr:alpha/beta fold hydrolase [Chitinophagales bacterium]
MPLLETSYDPFWKNPHFQTILPNLKRNVSISHSPETYEIATDDDDFLEFDLYPNQSKTLVILSHGLEGNSRRTYMLGMAQLLSQNGYDVLAWNYRSCGEKMNRQLRFYHSGEITDIHRIVTHAVEVLGYQNIILGGFSMGGSVTLNYLARPNVYHDKIRLGFAISVPLDLGGACHEINQWHNRLYLWRFMRNLKQKVRDKHAQFPQDLPISDLKKVKNFYDFDDIYTAPLHGFDSAMDYYQKASSLPYLPQIKTPTLIFNALNDSFLNALSYPKDQELNNEHIYLAYPQYGGHVGFYEAKPYFYHEIFVANFLEERLSSIDLR